MSHFQKKTNQNRNKPSTKVVSQISPSLVTLPPAKCDFFLLCNYAVSISFRTKNFFFFEQKIVQDRKQPYAKKKHISLSWKLMLICIKEEFLWMIILNLTEILTNHVGLLGHIFSKQMLETTNRWLTGYR